MEIRERTIGEVVVLDIVGRMVLSESLDDKLLKDRIAELLGQSRRNIILNLDQVSQVDTSGLTALVAAHLAVARRGGRLALSQPTRRIRDLLGITRLNTLLDLFGSDQDAIASIGRAADLRT
jgi:anti-sigma B factor antagonist